MRLCRRDMVLGSILKVVTISAVVALLAIPQVMASAVEEPASPSPGGGWEVRLLRSDTEGIELEFVIPAYSSTAVVADGRAYDIIEVPGLALTSEEGKPRVPVKAAAIGIPPQAEVTIEVLEAVSERLPGTYELIPQPSLVVDIPLDEGRNSGEEGWPLPRLEGRRVVEDEEVYGSDAFFPGEVVKVSQPTFLRSQRLVGVQFYPVQYNPQSGEVELYRSVKVRLNLAYRDGHDRSSWTSQAEPEEFESLLEGTVLNYESARGWRLRRVPTPAIEPEGLPAPAYRVVLDRDGVYELTYDALAQAGVPVGSLLPSTFQIYYEGEEIAIQVEGEGDGSFDPEDSILFWGEGIESKYTVDNVYWLTYGQDAGLRMPERDGSPGGVLPEPASTLSSIHLEKNSYYWSLMPDGDELERWYGAYSYAPGEMVETAELGHVAEVGGTATLQAALIGYTSDAGVNPDHHVQVSVNGESIGDMWWDGVSYEVAEFSFPQGYLQPGENEVRFEVPGDTGASQELDLLDWFDIEYRHAYKAEGDRLRFGGDEAGDWEYTIGEFTVSEVEEYEILDITVVTQPQRIVNAVVEPGGVSTYTLRFEDSITQPVQYWAQTSAQRLPPVRIELDAPSDLMSPGNGADVIIVAHADFYTAMEPLLEHRVAQGYRGVLVDVQDVYDEFGFGRAEPQAIRDFLAYAYHNWVEPSPSYVLLVGDGHYDANDYYGYGRTNYIPAYLAFVDPWLGETASDNWYVELAGDRLPEMHVGRLPANTHEEASAAVAKVLAYESLAPAPWRTHTLWVTDDPDSAGDFYALSDAVIADSLPQPYTYTKAYLGQTCGSGSACRTEIVARVNEGQLIVNYVGHAQPQYWAIEQVFRVADVGSLANDTRLPVFLPMTCQDGAFHSPFPGSSALGETVAMAEGKGAIASWSPTGFGVVSGHDELDRGFLEAVFQNGIRDIGAATLAGKLRLWNTGSHLDLLDTYLLFGDPALRINSLGTEVGIDKSVTPTTPLQPTDPLTYTLSVVNEGPAMAHNVVITDLVPVFVTGTQVVFSSFDLEQRPGDGFVWDVEDLEPGTSGTIVIRGTVDGNAGVGWFSNEAQISTTAWETGTLPNEASVSSFIIAGPPGVIEASATPGQIPVGGSVSTIEALVTDLWGNPVADGTQVTFSTDLGSVNPASATTNGVATTLLTAGTVAGVATVSGQSGDALDTTYVTLLPGSPLSIVLVASSASLPADGQSESTLTATVWDSYGNGVADGTVVTFTTTLGSVSPVTVETQNGVADSTLTAGMEVGTATVVAATAGLVSEPVEVSMVWGNRVYLPLVFRDSGP